MLVLPDYLIIFLIYIDGIFTKIGLYQDTFRGRVCECPVVNGVQYKGDGYTSCERMFFNFYIVWKKKTFCVLVWKIHLCLNVINSLWTCEMFNESRRLLVWNQKGPNLLCLFGNNVIKFETLHPNFTLFLTIFSYCWIQNTETSGCRCPSGFKGDGLKCEGENFSPTISL